MKKIIISTIVIILITSIFVISTLAAGTVATTEGKSCAKGSTVTLNVSISSTSNVTSGAVEVIYDKNILELVSAQWLTSDTILSTFDKSTNMGAFAYQAGKTLNGKIFSVTFKVRSNAPVGKIPVSCNIQLKTGSNNISVTNQSGYVNVTCNHSFTVKNNQYLASPATCSSLAKYYYVCSICGEKGTTTYTTGTTLPHSYVNKVATAQYLVSKVSCVDQAEYYYSCSCGAKGTTKFTGDASWSHNFDNHWFMNADGHWQQCLDCGAEKNYSSHKTNGKSYCSECYFVVSGAGGHVHSFDENWMSNEAAHWHECSCGEKKDIDVHVFGEGTVTKQASVSSNGEKTYTCTICSAKRYEEIVVIVQESGKSGGCYIATSVYGSYDCPEVWTLRRFRDDVLGSTWYGRAFIHTYYAVSPTLVEWFGEADWFQNIWRGVLDWMVENLNDRGFEDTPYNDKEW